MVSALWDLADWARKPWRPAEDSAEATQVRARERARARRERWIRVGWVVLIVALVLWMRTDTGALLLALPALQARHPRAVEYGIA